MGLHPWRFSQTRRAVPFLLPQERLQPGANVWGGGGAFPEHRSDAVIIFSVWDALTQAERDRLKL